MINHTGDRVIGHNLIDHHFSQVRADKRIRQTDPEGYSLPFANLDEFMAAQRQGRSAENIANVVEPIQAVIEPSQSIVAAAQSTRNQAEVTTPATADELPIDAATADAATAGGVVEEVAAMSVQKARRVKRKQKATPGQEVESSLAAEQLTIEVTRVRRQLERLGP